MPYELLVKQVRDSLSSVLSRTDPLSYAASYGVCYVYDSFVSHVVAGVYVPVPVMVSENS